MKVNNITSPIKFTQSYEEKYKDKLFDLEDEPEIEEESGFCIPTSNSDVIDALRASIFAKAPKTIKNGEEYEIYLRNMFPREIRPVQNNSYRGEALIYSSDRINRLKKCGVKRIIALDNLSGYEKVCEKYGIEYIYADMFNNLYDNPAVITEAEYEKCKNIYKNYGMQNGKDDYYEKSRKFIEDFKKFSKIIKQGHFYIGCNHGLSRTNTVLYLLETFIPELDKTVEPEPFEVIMAKNLYAKLTNQDKKDLHITKEYDEKLKSFFSKQQQHSKNF